MTGALLSKIDFKQRPYLHMTSAVGRKLIIKTHSFFLLGVDVLHLSQQFLNYVGTLSCLPGLDQCL